jgi:phage replication-related protein YjqB (UPF0714/DUF867 family)
MVLNPDFKEFLQLLNDNQVRYLVTGGYAVAFHGYPRYTKDLDIWIELSRDNAQKLIAALDEFGFASLGLSEQDFLEPGTVIQLGHPPNRIDLLTTVTGVDFETCYRSRIVIRVDDSDVNFIDLDNLRKNKQAVGRPQDLADLDNLR